MLDHRGVTVLNALYTFFQEHQCCGDLDGGVEGDRVWMTCSSVGKLPIGYVPRWDVPRGR